MTYGFISAGGPKIQARLRLPDGSDGELHDRNQNQTQSEQPPRQEWDPSWMNLVLRMGELAVDKIIIPTATRAVTGRVDGGGTATGGTGAFPSWLGGYPLVDPAANIAVDSLSSVDHFRARAFRIPDWPPTALMLF
jgi:hypothetical protein